MKECMLLKRSAMSLFSITMAERSRKLISATLSAYTTTSTLHVNHGREPWGQLFVDLVCRPVFITYFLDFLVVFVHNE